MAQRYPTQDLTDALEGYLHDYGTLALRYSLAAVRDALADWRVKPGARFFPQPNEIAEDIERKRDAGRVEQQSRESRARREEWERGFWSWVDSRLQDDDTRGMTEQQFLDTIKRPGYTGRKARG